MPVESYDQLRIKLQSIETTLNDALKSKSAVTPGELSLQASIKALKRECNNTTRRPLDDLLSDVNALVAKFSQSYGNKATQVPVTTDPLENLAQLLGHEADPVVGNTSYTSGITLFKRPDSETRDEARLIETLFDMGASPTVELASTDFTAYRAEANKLSADKILTLLNAAVANYIVVINNFLGELHPEAAAQHRYDEAKRERTPAEVLLTAGLTDFKNEHTLHRLVSVKALLRQMVDIQQTLQQQPAAGATADIKQALRETQLRAAERIVESVRRSENEIQQKEPDFKSREKTTMGKVKSFFGKGKVSITSIYQLDDRQAPGINVLVGAFAKVNKLPEPIPYAPRPPLS